MVLHHDIIKEHNKINPTDRYAPADFAVEPVEKVIFHLKTLEEHGQTIIEIDI